LLTALFESGTTGIAVTLVGATAARTNPARAIAVSALAVFDRIVDEGGVESSREPDSEHDRQTSDLIFQSYMTRWPTTVSSSESSPILSAYVEELLPITRC
jgi:hypothetical protein